MAAGLAWAIVPSFRWRPLLATSALGAVLVLWIRRTIPESPRYLAISGRLEEAKAVLAQVSEANQHEVPLGDLQAPTREDKSTVARCGRRASPRHAHALDAWFSVALAYYGVFTWLPSLFVERGFTFLATYQNTFGLALAQLPSYFSAAYLVERWGRRATLTNYLLARGLHLPVRGHDRAGVDPGRRDRHELLLARRLGRPLRLHAGALSDRDTHHGLGVGTRHGPDCRRALPHRRRALDRVALSGALSLWALAFVAGSLAVGTLGWRRRIGRSPTPSGPPSSKQEQRAV